MNRDEKLKEQKEGKDMRTVRFAYYLNSEYHHESLSEKSKGWFGFMRSFKVKQRITV